MPSSTRRGTTIATLLIVVAVAGVALALARVPTVWQVLDAPRSGDLAAGLRYGWLFAGLTLSVILERSVAGRFLGYSGVLAGSLAIPLFFPHLDLGIEPDVAGYFNFLTVVAACACLVAAWVAGRPTVPPYGGDAGDAV
jgi:MFS-type transporter involved in bile tolerance (Atg22 family)